MTVAVEDQSMLPDSKPGLLSRLLPEGGGGGVVPQVATPTGTAMAENEAAIPAHSDEAAP